MSLLASLAVLNLLLHLAAVVAVLWQCWRGCITSRLWRHAWMALLLGMLLILPFRIADFWAQPLAWRTLLATPMTLCFLWGFYHLATLCQRDT